LPEKEKTYQLPPIDLLEPSRGRPSAGDIKTNSAIIKKTLESFDIPVEMSEVSVGPTVTQYSLKPAEGIKLSKITSLSNDLALALASHPIRIEAPIPGRSLVGIEIPNKIRVPVRIRELIERPEFQSSLSNLTVCLGRDVSGSAIYADLARMPHLLVAGSTGSGKTIFLNTLINSLLYRNGPDDLKFLLIDPKRVEFTIYSKLPHFLYPAIVDTQKATNALRWLIDEMDRRFKMLSEVKSRDILSYNNNAQRNGKEKIPYIILVIDELADLMAAKGRDVETAIVRLAQMSRAVGIHLVVATQRPSVEVITGLIKANITSRITFQVASQVDSRTVLDVSGAEKLLGSGDMLFLSTENLKPKRIQSVYITEKEVKKVATWIRTNADSDEGLDEVSEMEGSLEEKLNEGSEQASEVMDFGMDQDPLYEEAKRVVVQTRRASASLLQRKLRIGYARAARLIDVLEDKGIVGPSQGAKSREVYASDESYKTEDSDKDSQDEEWEQV
jgi:S-DNA-T family DNA segregation ATPase FtsK/SpoIIIE